MDNLNSLLRQLGETTGITNLALDDSGRCTLLFDEETTLEIRKDEEARRLVLSCVVCNYAPEKDLPVLRELAAANLDGVGTGGAVLAANTRDRYVVLQHREPVDSLEWPRFSALLTSMLDATEFWRKHLTSLPGEHGLTQDHAPVTARLA